MFAKRVSKLTGVQVAQYDAAASDRCNFHCQDKDGECGEWAVTALVVTAAEGSTFLLKLCRRHLCRLSILLIE
jgi:hypothetical protein